MNWNQTGMPSALVRRLGQNQDLAELVKDLTTELANTKQELENANRRYERLTADLAKRGIGIEEGEQPQKESSRKEPPSPLDGQAEWEEWDRRFQSLLG